MVSARIAEIVLRDERAVIPIGSYNPRYGVKLSLPSIIGEEGALQILQPEMCEDERQALQRSADTLRAASARFECPPAFVSLARSRQYNAAENRSVQQRPLPLTFCDRHLSQAFPRTQE
jgi:hypothetical protein